MPRRENGSLYRPLPPGNYAPGGADPDAPPVGWEFRKCGKPSCWCRTAPRGHGPYRYTKTVDGGKVLSVYHGRGADPTDAGGELLDVGSWEPEW